MNSEQLSRGLAEVDKRFNKLANWAEGKSRDFDWILKQRDDFKFYKHGYATLLKKCEELERRIQELEGLR